MTSRNMERGFSVVFIFILTTIHLWAIHANYDEGNALITFKNGLNDTNNVLQSWNPNEDPCTWFHITCNGTNVTRIDLGDRNLSGRLVPDLANLKELQYLELYNNHLYGQIPKEFGNLTKLLSLDLYDNNLDGLIPEELGNLANLIHFRLNTNNFTGPLPDAIWKLAEKLNGNFSVACNADICAPSPDTPSCNATVCGKFILP